MMKRRKHRGDEGEQRIRSFLAIDLDSAVLDAVRDVQKQFREIEADVRWVRPEGMHVTLKFLGHVDADRLPRLHDELGAALRDQPALHLRVCGLGGFPSLRRPRVLWVGLTGDELAALAQRVDGVVSSLGFEPEQRAFTAHLTIGRVNSLRGWAALEVLVKEHIDDEFGPTEVRAVTLYRSKLQPGGAVYTALWTIPLNQNKGTA